MNTNKLSNYLAPSLADVFFLFILFLLSFYWGNGLLADGDTGYHIRAGEYIISNLSVPQYDIFSFHTPPLPWTAHEWLSEVIMALVHGPFGLTGIVVFFAVLIALVYYLLFKTLRKNHGNIFAAVVIIILVFLSSHIHWLARPHIFSLLLTVIWYRILDDYQYGGINRLYLLPPLMLLWVNLHGGFIVGFVFLGIYMVGNLLCCWLNGSNANDVKKRKLRNLIYASFPCLIAALINPYGYKILLFPFKLVSDKYLISHVQEFLSPNFHDFLIFKYLFLLTITLLALSRKRLNYIELILVLFFANMALVSVRHITLFAIVIAPIIFRVANDLIDDSSGKCYEFLRRRAVGIGEIDASTRGFLWPFAGVALVSFFAATGAIEFKFDEKSKPVAAVEFLKKEMLTARMYNNDEFGDYIIYSAWPEIRVFFDGRSDMYGAEMVKEYFNVSHFKPGWERVLEKYEIDMIMFNSKSVLSRYLSVASGWQLIYADNVAHIFIRNINKYRDVCERYRDIEPIVVYE